MNNQMEEMSKGKNRYLSSVAWGYGIVVAVVNYIGFLLAKSGGMPVPLTEDYYGWLRFISENNGIITIISIFSFIMPIAIIFWFQLHGDRDMLMRIINLPFVYSAIGSLGWIFTFILEFIFLLIAKYKYNISIAEIGTASFLNILQECICIFTLAFFSLDLIHRKIVLPKLFPDGNLSRYNIKIKPSVRFLVHVFYLSVGIFPVFFLTSTLVTLIRNNDMKVNSSVFVILVCIIVFGFIILWTFSDYFSSPIKKLKVGTHKIKEGDYGYHVDIVSNDDFGELADAFNEMASSLNQKTKKIGVIQDSIIKGMAVMIESRDNSTGGHINRTSDCIRVFGQKLRENEEFGISPDFYDSLVKAAPMHDLGKIAVDDAVLRKPGRFTDEEYEKMKTHAREGARIVESVLNEVENLEFKKIAINVAHYHHEKWNGTGYPEKISGENIPLEARIMALADVFDALVSKESMSYDKAFEIIQNDLGTHFDPKLGQLFLDCREDLIKLYDNY